MAFQMLQSNPTSTPLDYGRAALLHLADGHLHDVQPRAATLRGGEVRDRVLRYFHEIANARTPAATDPASSAPVLERLSKALEIAGIDRDKLEHSAENRMRLAIVASLFDLRPSEPARTVSALPKWRLTRVLDHVDANIAESLTLAELASVAGMSRMHFASQFRKATGLRPHDYVLRKRIEHAQHLLVTTSQSLVDVALSVGFQTQSHFTTIFKKIVGNTPYQWRREKRVAG